MAEIRTLSWMTGLTIGGKIRNEHIRGSVKVG